MATLNTSLGWITGDEIRVLLAAGLPIGPYQITQITADMNTLATTSPSVVGPIQDLLDAYDTAQAAMVSLNNDSGGKTLIKADVLEWKVAEVGSNYGPERELLRIQSLLYQYFALSPLFSSADANTTTTLLRS